MQTYQVHKKHDGSDWQFTGITFYTRTLSAAKKRFTEWIIEWLDDLNNDHAITTHDDIVLGYQDGEYLDSFSYDTYCYKLEEDKEND